MTIKLVGIENKKYKLFKQKLCDVILELGLQVEIEEVNDLQYIMNHKDIKTIPALEINKEVMIQVNGTMPNRIQLTKIFNGLSEDKANLKSIGFISDLSNKSGKALIYTNDLAEHYGAKIAVCNVLEPSFDESNPYYTELLIDMVSARKSHLKWFLEFHLGDKGKKIRRSVLVGNVKNEIMNYMNDSGHSLFVMNSNKHGFMRKLLFGSISKYIKKNANKDVIMLSGETTFKSIDKMVFILLNAKKQRKQLINFLAYAEHFGSLPSILSLDSDVKNKQDLIDLNESIKIGFENLEDLYFVNDQTEAINLELLNGVGLLSSSRVDNPKKTINLLEKLFPLNESKPTPFLFLS